MASFEIKHQFVSPKPNGSETDLIRPSDWNAEHEFILTGSGAVARLGQGTGSAEFVPFGTGANEIPLNSHLGSAAYATLGSAIGNALQVVDVGGGVAGLPVIDGRNITNLTLPAAGALPVASTSQQGIVQLTNSFTSTSQTLAVTPKALFDGLAGKASTSDLLEVYSGSSQNLTDYPVGTYLLCTDLGGFRNAATPIAIAISSGGVGAYAFGAPAAFGSTATLSGTWRARGGVKDEYVSIPSSSNTIGAWLYQRVA